MFSCGLSKPGPLPHCSKYRVVPSRAPSSPCHLSRAPAARPLPAELLFSAAPAPFPVPSRLGELLSPPAGPRGSFLIKAWKDGIAVPWSLQNRTFNSASCQGTVGETLGSCANPGNAEVESRLVVASQDPGEGRGWPGPLSGVSALPAFQLFSGRPPLRWCLGSGSGRVT